MWHSTPKRRSPMAYNEAAQQRRRKNVRDSKSIAQGTWPRQKQMMAVLAALRQADQLITEEGRKKYEEIRKENADE